MDPITASLLAWYDRCARVLPWRGFHDAYRTWVSEAMLQQTRVETVLSYYPRFLERFPSLADLAAAPEADVLKAWEGLGYYSRARNLLKGARQVMDEYGVPKSAYDLDDNGNTMQANGNIANYHWRKAVVQNSVVITKKFGYMRTKAN